MIRLNDIYSLNASRRMVLFRSANCSSKLARVQLNRIWLT